jgi:mono/diheme cytochrome c family protein
MIRSLAGAFVLVLSINAACAQSAQLNDTQRQGRALFNQSCRVCHTPPSLNAPLYGPALNQDTQRGKDDALADVIRDGSPRMPGFKYQFNNDQIAAIVAYLRTVPAQQAAAQVAPPQPASRGERERQQREAD